MDAAKKAANDEAIMAAWPNLDVPRVDSLDVASLLVLERAHQEIRGCKY